MHLFVTGGTGFIGSHFLTAAHAAGHQVTALRRSPSSRNRIELSQSPRWLDSQMPALTPKDFSGIDVVVHLAAHGVQAGSDSLIEHLEQNLMHPLAMCRSAYQSGVRRFVIAGSCFEYGKAGERYEWIPADAPLEPTSAYAVSKAAASIAFRGFAAETNSRLSILRIFQAYGDGEADGRLWPSLRRAAMAGKDFPMTAGEQIRDFVPAESVAAQLLAACSDETVKPGEARIRNVGSGRPQSVREFAEACWHQWNASGELKIGEIPYRRNEVMRYVGAVDR